MTTEEFAFWQNAYSAAVAAGADNPGAVAKQALADYRLSDPVKHAHDRGYEADQKAVSDADTRPAAQLPE